jgi:hypothetical protein
MFKTSIAFGASIKSKNPLRTPRQPSMKESVDFDANPL